MDAGGPATGLEDLSARADTAASELMARTRSLVPRTTRDYVSRRRLSVVLDGCTTPLVLLSAPAGSGKTALAAEWAHRIADARSVVWVSCHGEDADPLVEVLRGMRKSALTMPGATVEAGESAGQRPTRDALAEQIIEVVDRSAAPWTVFLDGYDILTTSAAEELDRLLTYAGPALQVVLTTRVDPILPLHRYRLDATMLEVRAADLAFTDEESACLLRSGGVELAPDDVHALNLRLAGWVTGLRFALPVLKVHPEPSAMVADAVTYNGNINAYLVEEVLDIQPPELRDLILTTSVPDTLCPDLVEALTGEPAALTELRLMRANVLLESTPGDERSLRYAPFFRDLARAQLAYEHPDRLHQLHRQVAAWHVGRGEWESAFRHFGRAGQPLDCAGLFVEHLLVGRLLFERPDESLRRLVASTTPAAPPSATAHLLDAAVSLADGDHEGCALHLAAARAREPVQGRAAVTVAVLEAVLGCASLEASLAEALCVRATEALDAERRPHEPGADDTEAVLLLAGARAALRLGALGRAEGLLEAALHSGLATWSSAYRSLCLSHAAVLHARTGLVRRSTDEAEQALEAAESIPAAAATSAHLARAYAALLVEDYAACRGHLAETIAHPEPMWQVVQAVLEIGLRRPPGAAGRVGVDAMAVTRVEAIAEVAGPLAVAWVMEETAWPSMTVHGDPPAPSAHVRWSVRSGPAPAAIGADGRVVEGLTHRELEVLAAMSEWLTTAEIAEKLFVSVNTVRTHVRNILTKLGVSRRNAAIREALRLGLLTPEPESAAASRLVWPT